MQLDMACFGVHFYLMEPRLSNRALASDSQDNLNKNKTNLSFREGSSSFPSFVDSFNEIFQRLEPQFQNKNYLTTIIDNLL